MTTAAPAQITTAMKATTAQPTWVELGSDTACDAGAGEVYRRQSPGKVSDIATCKQSCEDDQECKSITFFRYGWCSHFSTECTNTKRTSKAVSMVRLGTQQTATTSTKTAGPDILALGSAHSLMLKLDGSVWAAGL